MPSVMLSTPKSDVRARYEEGKEQLNECKACQTGVDEFDDLLNYIGIIVYLLQYCFYAFHDLERGHVISEPNFSFGL